MCVNECERMGKCVASSSAYSHWFIGGRLAKIEDTKVEKALLTFVNNNKSNFISRCWSLSKCHFDSGALNSDGALSM